jgi:glycine/D-amino acid oxidase-like deaminating enzyme
MPSLPIHSVCCFGNATCQGDRRGRVNEHDDNYDVVVIGGGAGGLAAAVALLRSRRSVLLVDAGDPRNAPAGHVHNFLTQDGTPPEDLYAAGRTEVQAYGGQVARARVDALERSGDLRSCRVPIVHTAPGGGLLFTAATWRDLLSAALWGAYGSGALGSRCGAGAWPPGRGPASPWNVASDRPGTRESSQ